jgi:hypothetical protein
MPPDLRAKLPADLRTRLRANWHVIALLVVVVLAAVRWTGSVASAEWSTALDERLADAGAGANSAMLDTERTQLTALRAFTFSAGVADAIKNVDVPQIEQLLGPVDANLGIPMVDVLDATGRVVFAFRGEGEVPPIYRQRNDLGIVQRALRGEPDQYGERFTTLVVTDEGSLVASTGPVRIGTEVVGAILVMTPLSDVLANSTNAHGEMLTVYSGDGGVPLATTAPVKPRTLPDSYARLLPPDKLPVTSSYDVPGGSAREQLGALVVRHEAVAWLGVADRDKAGHVGGQVSLLTAAALVLASMLAGLITIRWRKEPAETGDDEPTDDDPMPKTAALPVPEEDRIAVPMGAGRPRW